MKKKKVVFLCVHNSCRSQIAEALGKHYGKDIFESYSAGNVLKDKINPDAVRLMKKIYGIDMEETQYCKLASDIPDIDIAISMGCEVSCPYVGKNFPADWELEDPTGKSDEEFIKIIEIIDRKIHELIEKLK